MIKLSVVRNIPDFLLASNIDYVVNYCLKSTEFGLSIIAYIDKYLCLLNFLKNEPLDSGHQIIVSNFPGAEYKIVSDVPIDFENIGGVSILAEGTQFQEKVWRALLTIPRGSTIYYEDVAKIIGTPKAVRACGTAVGKNPVALVIPCHRVIGKNGNVLKFGCGAEVKKKLLEHEGVLI